MAIAMETIRTIYCNVSESIIVSYWMKRKKG